MQSTMLCFLFISLLAGCHAVRYHVSHKILLHEISQIAMNDHELLTFALGEM